ncbi:MAG: peptidyl-prolyl cis-trans isomerase, partial [Verrucomicrobiales bacterium]|nr:peptidyl-prolyl cis-trans isomerase [Verrucomicrobiales bacterium]
RAYQAALIAKLKECELEPRLRSLTVSEEELQASDEVENRRTGRSPQMRLAILRLQINPKASPAKLKETEARLEEARVKAQSLPPNTIGFGALAIDYSDDDTTRYRGGDLGWLERDSAKYHFDPAMLAAGSALKTPGETSPIIRGREALFLVRLIGQRVAEEATPKPAEDLVRHRAHIEKRRTLENAFAAETKQMIPVTMDPIAISKLTSSFKPAAPLHPGALP